NKSLNIVIDLDNKINQAANFAAIGNVYAKHAKDSSKTDSIKGVNIALAKEYLNRSIKLSKETNTIHNLSSFLYDLSDVDSLNGDYKNSLEHFKEAQKLKDSIFSSENQQKIANLDAQREIDIKANELKLKNKENELLKQQ